MTQKDLLYLEDAVEHETNLIDIWTFFKDSLEDEKLISIIKNEIKKHQSLKEKILNTMEDISNE